MAGFIQIKLDHSFVLSSFRGQVALRASSVHQQLYARADAYKLMSCMGQTQADTILHSHRAEKLY